MAQIKMAGGSGAGNETTYIAVRGIIHMHPSQST